MVSWGDGNTADAATREREYEVEKKVSDHISSMPFLWVEVEDRQGPNSLRGYVRKP
jgi:hypothetical protein